MAATLDDLLNAASALRAEVSTGFHNLATALGSGGGGGGKAPAAGGGGPFEKFAGQVAKAGTALTAFTVLFERLITNLGQQMARFVSLANPAVVMRFNMALDNAMSAMGRILVPVMERFTIVVQKLGDAMESLSPQAKALVAALATGGGLATAFGAVAVAVSLVVKTLGIWPAVITAVVAAFAGIMTSMSEGKELAKSLGGILKAVGTVVETLAAIFTVVFLPAIKLVAVVVKNVAEAIVYILRQLSRAAGLNLPDFDPDKKRAQAVRQSSVTDLQGFANRAYASAFGGAAGNVDLHILGENKQQTSILREISRNTAVRSGLGMLPTLVPPSLVPAATGLAAASNLSGAREPRWGERARRGFYEFMSDMRDRVTRVVD